MKPLQAGQLRKRLTFLTKSGSESSMTEPVQWTAFYNCYGAVDAVNAQLQYQTDVFISKSTYKIRIRHTTSHTFTVGDRIQLEDGTLFDIQGILNPEMRNRELDFLAYIINPQA